MQKSATIKPVLWVAKSKKTKADDLFREGDERGLTPFKSHFLNDSSAIGCVFHIFRPL